jgi:hypothetical protein
LFFKKANVIFYTKRSRSKLVNTRRSTVPIPPLRLAFLGPTYDVETQCGDGADEREHDEEAAGGRVAADLVSKL